jgi:hemerythrin-like metal-binding protein
LESCVCGLSALPGPPSFVEDFMHRFETTPELETGNADIDGQLQTLFAMANEILYSGELARSSEQFRRAVTFMVSYLEYHFAAEELAMLERGYESRRFHTAFHDHVRREARTIAASVVRKASTEETRSAIYFMLEDWVEYHVRNADRQLASFLHEQAPANGTAKLPGIRPLKASGSVSADFDEQILARASGLA